MSDRTQGQRYWDRDGWVDIEGYGNPPKGLDFRFEAMCAGDVYPNFSVGVLGLSMKNINALTVWNPSDAISASRRVSVYAGYKSDGIRGPICTGYVLRAIPTPPPEAWINFECVLSLGKKKIPSISTLPQIRGKAFDIAFSLAKEAGFSSLMWNAKSVRHDAYAEFTFSCSNDFLIEKFVRKLGLSAIYGTDGTVSIYDRKPWYSSSPDPNRTPVISSETGLLMLGNVDSAGATVRVRLNDRYSLFGWVKLETTLIPSASGYYFIVTKKHVGHYRGDEWYTELKMIRKAK